MRFGLFPGRSPLLGESLVYFLFLQVLRCFSSLRLPLHLGVDNWPSASWVVPFGNPRIKDYLHLPEAYRSLSRPSSPPRASKIYSVSKNKVFYLQFLVYQHVKDRCTLNIKHETLNFRGCLYLVENIGVEPMTPCLQSKCSSQLS